MLEFRKMREDELNKCEMKNTITADSSMRIFCDLYFGGRYKMVKKGLLAIFLLIMLLCVAGCSEKQIDTITYAVYPYLPDAEYYQEIIEKRWAEIEPDIKLIRAEWDCYTAGSPDGIDVVMYDAVMRDKIVDSGWIKPIERNEVQKIDDIYPFALDGLTVDDRLYGIPVFLCGNFLIYDQDYETLAMAEHFSDMKDMSEILIINSEIPDNQSQYRIEAIADSIGEANPTIDEGWENSMHLIDQLAIKDHRLDDNIQVAKAYDSGIGLGYIGFSESMRFLTNRADRTGIKSVSFSDRENTLRLYEDAVAVTSGVKGQKYEKCLELMNVISEETVLTKLSVQEGIPQYLMLARKTPYQNLKEQFQMYTKLEELAGDEKNHIILTP